MKHNYKIQDFKFKHVIKTRYRDLDSFNHINNATFLSYFEDIVKPNKKYRKPNDKEKKALLDLVKRLKDCKEQMDPEAIQTIVYSVGKDNGYQENLREWFKVIYEILLNIVPSPSLSRLIVVFPASCSTVINLANVLTSLE